MNLRDTFQVTYYNQIPVLAYGLIISSTIALGLVFWLEAPGTDKVATGSTGPSLAARASDVAASLENSAQNLVSSVVGAPGSSP